MTEILPFSLRGTVLPICGAIMTLANISVGMTFPVLLDTFGVAGALGPYVAWNALAMAVCAFCMIETKGETKDSIAKAFFSSGK